MKGLNAILAISLSLASSTILAEQIQAVCTFTGDKLSTSFDDIAKDTETKEKLKALIGSNTIEPAALNQKSMTAKKPRTLKVIKDELSTIKPEILEGIHINCEAQNQPMTTPTQNQPMTTPTQNQPMSTPKTN